MHTFLCKGALVLSESIDFLAEPSDITTNVGGAASFACRADEILQIPSWVVVDINGLIRTYEAYHLPANYSYTSAGLYISYVHASMNLSRYSCSFFVWNVSFNSFETINSTSGKLYIVDSDYDSGILCIMF